MQRTLFDADHNAFRESAREFVDRALRPNYEKYVEQRFIDREAWLEAGRQGLLGLEVPEEYGGSGAGDYRFNAVFGEELCKLSAGIASCIGIHADVVAPYLVDLCTEEQKQRWLPRFCSGEMTTGIGMTEPSGGSDLAALRSVAVRDGSDWILNGSKTFITNGYSADMIVVAARTSPEKGAKGITLFAVETGMKGFERGRKLDKVGQPESDTAELFFSDVRLPAEQVIGEVDRGFIYMMERPAAGAHRRCHLEPGARRADPAGDHRVHQGAQGVRPVHRVVPGQQVPARRAGHQGRRHAGFPRPVHARPHPRRADRRGRGEGEVLERGRAERGARRLRAAARRLRVHDRVPGRPRLDGRAGHQDLGRLQRDHEGTHRPRPRPVTTHPEGLC